MTKEERQRRETRAIDETLVLVETSDGYKVYSPTRPRQSYVVSVDGETLACTCPDYERHQNDPEWQCKHMLAVGRHLDQKAGAYDAEERRGLQDDGTAATSPAPPAPPSVPAQMYVKRSVSPDGRIDSLSVSVSWPIDGVATRDLKTRIENTLKLQSDVVSRFLAGTKPARETPEPTKTEQPEDASSQAAPARMLGIGGMDGRWGRRLYLTFDVNGRNVRLFGTQKQLAAAIADAGYPNVQHDVSEGLDLGLPCRVVTVPTADGKYLNVDRVLPPTGGRAR